VKQWHVETQKKGNNTMKIYYNLAPTEHAIVDVNITDGNFSASASICENFRNVSSGQCLEELTAVDPVLVAMWREWHLNDMQAGTPAQMAALKGFKGDYTAQCAFLEQQGLLFDPGVLQDVPIKETEALNARINKAQQRVLGIPQYAEAWQKKANSTILFASDFLKMATEIETEHAEIDIARAKERYGDIHDGKRGFKYGSAWLKKELPQSVYDWFNGLKAEPFTDWPVVTSVHAQAKRSGFADYHQHHVVTIKHNGQKIKFDFWAGKAEPANINGALDCFLSDADNAYMTKDNIVENFGVSIKDANQLYKGFQKAKEKLTNWV
jgi:hypothetical protein